MRLYIIRHGNATDPFHPSVTSDEARELTAAGRGEVATMAALLKRLAVAPSLILSSPLIRARQTADILADVLDAEPPLTSPNLAPGGSLAGVLDDIVSRHVTGDVIVGGHMPGVGALAGFVAWGDPGIVFPFRTAEVCRIDLDGDRLTPGAGDLRWLIPPRIAEKLLHGGA